ncbi:alpha-E domain-containing protein, partial [Burkholderia cepacia]
ETALILGSFYSTMLRNEIFDFAQIGAFVERADNTARIIDVKYHLLLPSVSHVGTILDNYQWETILRCVAAHRSYRWVYDVQYKPMNIADYLILNGRMPRSLRYCYGRVVSSLNLLAKDYGVTHPCHDTATKILQMLSDTSVERIFKSGLHEFLTDFIGRNNSLGIEIAQAYNFD